MLFYSFFKTLVGKEVVVELKNDLAVRGTLHSVDQYLNIKLLNVSVDDVENYPHMVRAAAHPRLLPARRPSARAPPPHPADPRARPRAAAIGEELLHPWLGDQIRAAAVGRGRHRAAAGRDEEGGGAAKKRRKMMRHRET